MKIINIAIDGYSSCGKSTLAKHIAKIFEYVYIDTGAMYRSVALYLLRKGTITEGIVDIEQALLLIDEIDIRFSYNADKNISETYLNGENVEDEIRGMAVSSVVSKISKLNFIRKKLVNIQQKAGKNKGVVMDGRDIGTVVFPDAELKLFIQAEAEVRAERRYNELKNKGVKITMQEVVKNLSDRDFDDINRADNPLKKAADAIVIDNTFMSIKEQNAKAEQLVKRAIAKA